MSRARGPRVRHWIFTSYAVPFEFKFDEDIFRYCCFQREICPDTKRQHVQGYAEFRENMRTNQVSKLLGGCHVEPRGGTRKQARDYTRKPESAISDSWEEHGVWRPDVNGKRKLRDMLKTDMTLAQLIEEDPFAFVCHHRGLKALYQYRLEKKAKKWRSVEVLVYVGKTGTGKTRKAVEEPDHFIMPCSDKMWLDGYQDQRTLIIDDFYGNIKYSLLLRVIDGHEIQLPVKGGFVWCLWTKVIFTSNSLPCTWYSNVLDTDALMRRINQVIMFPIGANMFAVID